jgi:aspartyl-tRNA(Asn)/glutamyl-tRNA(Gln) amidotransferase subunit A
VTGVNRRDTLHLAGAAMTVIAAPALARKRSSRDRLEAALARIADPAGEGARAVLTLYTSQARAAADAADARTTPLGPLDGAIITIKDLFDVAGEPTRAGSRVLADASPASADAPVVARVRAAGAVIIGKTNMTEFALSGVGANPHYGTPGNPRDRARIPGGSTSGGGVAVADGMCEIAIGTDTGGSTRIPAALCGVTGFKPSQARVPTAGAFALAHSLDSVGPIATSVAGCADADAVLAGMRSAPLAMVALTGLKLGLPQGGALSDLDATISKSFVVALASLTRAGVALSDQPLPELATMAAINTPVSLVVAEAYALHQDRLTTAGMFYDPMVRTRMLSGAAVTPEMLATMQAGRRSAIAAMHARLAGLDAFILPTTPIIAPLLADVATNEGFSRNNSLLLRNTAIANFFDLCAISLPLPITDGHNSGLMLIARNGADRQLLAIAAAVEALLKV